MGASSRTGFFPSFSTERGVFYLGDAREVLKTIPDSSVDAVVTDPPWGVGFDEYDDPEVLFEVEDELWRVLKPDAWLVFYYTPKLLFELARLKRFRYVWMIPYIFWSFGTISKNPLGGPRFYSIIMVMAKGKPKVAVSRRDIFISSELPVVEENIREPQFKPTYVTMELLSMFTRPGDLVLDPFAGYGSIPLVCELFERRWVAVEIDPEKYAIARRVLEERRIPGVLHEKSRRRAGGREKKGG